MIQKLCFTLIFLVGLMSCGNNTQQGKRFMPPENTPKKRPHAEVVMDSISLDAIPSSYKGITHLFKDSLYFIDKHFGHIFVYDLQGNLKRRFLGFGRGPNELATNFIDGFQLLPENRMLFIGSSYDYHIHRLDGKRLDKGKIDWQRKRTKKEIQTMSNPPYTAPVLYSFFWGKFITRNIKNHVYFATKGYVRNFTSANQDFLEKGSAFGLLNANASPITVDGFMGRRPPLFYENYHYIPQFTIPNFDIDKKQKRFFVNFEPDSVIYQYSRDFSVQHAFGRAGKAMNTNYKEFSDIEALNTREFLSERRTKGYYTWLEYVEKTKVLFRSYQKEHQATTDGLQIYKNRQLLADIDVPEGFRVTGYSAPWYYSHVMVDERAEKIWLYRFKVEP